MPTDPLTAESLRGLVPDVRDREIYLCGPTQMMEAVRDGLQSSGISRGQIHFERFEF